MVFPISKERDVSTAPSDETSKKPTRSFKEVLKEKRERELDKKFKEKEHSSDAPSSMQEGLFAIEREMGNMEMAPSFSKVESSSLRELSPPMQALADKMGEHITVESQNGVSTIELEIDLSDTDSMFQGTQIIIEHYDTHPHSFNIQLLSPIQSTVDEFKVQLPALLKAVQTKLETFHIHFLPPAYPNLPSSKSRHKIEKTGKGRKQSNKKTAETGKNPFLN